MNIRRDLLIVLGAAALLSPHTLSAQSKQPVLIGWLSLNSRASGARSLAALKKGLAALGWKEGAQVRIEERWTDGQEDRLASLTQELAAKMPALIVAAGLRAAVNAAKAAPKLPIVMVSNNDPVAAGLVASLSRPGDMITGIAGFAADLAGKYLEFLIAAAPKVKRVGFLAYSGNPTLAGLLEVARRSATHYSLETRFAEVARAEEIEPAMLRLAKEGVQALVVLPSGGLFTPERQRILQFALSQRWPVISGSGCRRFAQL